MAARRGEVLAQPVELRDILPTFLDAAGVKFDPGDFDGKSMLELARGKTDGWRPYLDLEHSDCYAGESGWNALTDGRWKYIFHTANGSEQLFALQEDPRELHDLAVDAGHGDLLEKWRARMVEQLSIRGEQYVKNGKLVSPREKIIFGPNYPKDETNPAPRQTRPRARQKPATPQPSDSKQ
jgi:arylsulfatase A-like enzyme